MTLPSRGDAPIPSLQEVAARQSETRGGAAESRHLVALLALRAEAEVAPEREREQPEGSEQHERGDQARPLHVREVGVAAGRVDQDLEEAEQSDAEEHRPDGGAPAAK